MFLRVALLDLLPRLQTDFLHLPDGFGLDVGEREDSGGRSEEIGEVEEELEVGVCQGSSSWSGSRKSEDDGDGERRRVRKRGVGFVGGKIGDL